MWEKRYGWLPLVSTTLAGHHFRFRNLIPLPKITHQINSASNYSGTFIGSRKNGGEVTRTRDILVVEKLFFCAEDNALISDWKFSRSKISAILQFKFRNTTGRKAASLLDSPRLCVFSDELGLKKFMISQNYPINFGCVRRFPSYATPRTGKISKPVSTGIKAHSVGSVRQTTEKEARTL